MATIVALAGRRIDGRDPAEPRFPAEFIETVRFRIAAALHEAEATMLVCAAACGADLVALTIAAEAGIARRIVLPYDPAEFRERSVVDRPGDWGATFDRLIDAARSTGDLVVLGLRVDDPDAFRTTNAAILDEASRAGASAGAPVRAIAVWDGPHANGADTTGAFVDEARRRGIAVASIPILRRRRYDDGGVAARDDVADDPADPPDDPLIGGALAACAQVIVPEYDRADALALAMQRRHRLVVLTSATLGTAAIAVALLQTLPSVHAMGLIPLAVDVVATVVGALAVLLGVFASLQQRWYLERHRAEMLRLLKYRMLIDAATHVHDDASFARWRAALERETARLAAIDSETMHAWMEEKGAEPVVLEPHVDDAAPAHVAALRAYYLRARIDFQLWYFYRKALQYRSTDGRLRALPPVLFLLSVAFACAHFVIAAIGNGSTHAEVLSQAAVIASAICVVTAGMFRLLRSANEYARNTVRFRAKYFALVAVGARLEAMRSAREIALTLLETERLLEEEHREWLRLMHEAEWFG